MKTDMIDTTQIELHFEKANMAGEQAEKHVKSVVNVAIVAGEALNDAKALVPHGEWTAYLKKHWNYSQRLANQYMELSNSQHAANLTDAKSLREALRIIAAEKTGNDADDLTPRESRKTGQVTVLEPSAGETTEDTPAEYQDDDPAPDLPTQRATADGGRKKPESEKPKTRPVVAEIVHEPEQSPEMRIKFAVRELSQVLGQIDVSERKKTAKQLRKLADELDPPDESEKIPTAAKLQTVCDMECDWSEDAELREALRTWIAQKQKYKKTEWRYQTVEAFKKDLKHLRKTIGEVGIAAVMAILDKAERGGWRDWDHLNDNGKGTNGHAKNGGSRGLTAEDVFSAESLGRGR